MDRVPKSSQKSVPKKSEIYRLTIFRLFLPQAQVLDVAESDDLVPGDIVFSEWDDGSFELVQTQRWVGFKTSRYLRDVPGRAG